MQHSVKQILGGWLGLSRPPFHTVGILPFILGTVLAYKFTSSVSIAIFLLGVLAVILIMLSTYHAGEYFDYREDEISHRFYKSNFSGGSGVIQEGILPRSVPFWTSIISFILAGFIGLILQFYFKTGTYTLALGCLGAFPGFFYSTRPITSCPTRLWRNIYRFLLWLAAGRFSLLYSNRYYSSDHSLAGNTHRIYHF